MYPSQEVSMRLFGFCAVALLFMSATGPVVGDPQAPAADPCAGFKWDVHRERALFATAGASLAAGKDGPSAPAITPNHLDRAILLPAGQVDFPMVPGRMSPVESTYGGVYALTVPVPGKYRVALDSAFWIDIAAQGKLVPASDYEGQHDCAAPRKVVEFALDGKGPWMLQLSGASQAAVRITVTPAT
jgi:hypothetical protein